MDFLSPLMFESIYCQNILFGSQIVMVDVDWF